MATTDFVSGVTLSNTDWADDVDSTAYSVLVSVAGTNTITATGPANYAYAAARTPLYFIPAATNTGATTINVTPSGGSALGAKNIFWNGVALVGDELRANIPVAVIYDGTQFNIIANGFNAPFLDSHAVVEGGTDRTKKVRFEVDGLTTATTRVLTVLDADFTLGAATQAEQETGTSNTVPVTPGRQHFHPSAAKAWVHFNSAGNPAASYNFSSVTDNGVGNWTVNIAADMSSANYVGGITGGQTNPGTLRGVNFNLASAPAAGTFQILATDAVDGVTLRDPTNPNQIHMWVFGDQ